MKSGLVAASRKERWPEDFTHKGHIKTGRVPKESAYYLKDYHNDIRYAIAGGCFQLHGQEGLLQGLEVTKKTDPMPISNAGKKLNWGEVVKNSTHLATQSSKPPSTKFSQLSKLPTQTSAQTPIQIPTKPRVKAVPKQIPAQGTSQPTLPPAKVVDPVSVGINKPRSLKRGIDKDGNMGIPTKKPRIEGKEDEDIDIIPMMDSEDEKEPKATRELKDTRLICKFLYRIAKDQGQILVDLGNRYRGNL